MVYCTELTTYWRLLRQLNSHIMAHVSGESIEFHYLHSKGRKTKGDGASYMFLQRAAFYSISPENSRTEMRNDYSRESWTYSRRAKIPLTVTEYRWVWRTCAYLQWIRHTLRKWGKRKSLKAYKTYIRHATHPLKSDDRSPRIVHCSSLSRHGLGERLVEYTASPSTQDKKFDMARAIHDIIPSNET